MVPMVTEAWTLARCGGAAASKPAAVVQEVPALLHPVAKKPISLRGVAAASSACQTPPSREVPRIASFQLAKAGVPPSAPSSPPSSRNKTT
ncbi:hypothetical protein ZWY2020_046641 [Hordeum vulgare]|nr:hypothetical protein ZWY2020_046641 [Hordeum vulgare]